MKSKIFLSIYNTGFCIYCDLF